jgi:two-component system response regulator GlrR
MRSEKALIIEADGSTVLGDALRGILQPHFVIHTEKSSEHFVNADELVNLTRKAEADLVFIVFAQSSMETYASLPESIRTELSQVPIIAVVETCELSTVLELLKFGIADFLTAPLRRHEVLPRAWRLLKSDAEPSPSQLKTELTQLIGESPAFLAHVNRIPKVAACDANVLIGGETGTGKELYARAIHYNSARKGKPFMPVNCGAIPVELVENELFGHEKGAFTSASTLHIGLIQEANGGTLFLDEIDCLPIFSQVKLLRFLQEKEYRPLGATKMRRANVRIIAASNVDLLEAVEQGKCRRDLFYRLNTLSLTLPPLRERRDDIPLLTRHFLREYSRSADKRVEEISSEALHLLMVQQWPGNIRELEHAIEQAIILCDGPILQLGDLAALYSQNQTPRESLRQAKVKEIARFEKDYVQSVLIACSGNITRAAQLAQKNRRAFWQLVQKHHIDVKRIKSNLG